VKGFLWRSSSATYVDLLHEAAAFFPKEPSLRTRWFLSHKGGRTDRPDGSIDEIGPTVTVPAKYTYASVRLGERDRYIDLTFATSAATIEISGTDEQWLGNVERWARDVLRRHRPKWWWMVTLWGRFGLILPAVAVPILARTAADALGADSAVAFWVGSVLAWIIVGTPVVLGLQSRSVIGDLERLGGRRFGKDAALILIGAVAGFLVTRLGDALWPPSS